MRENLEAIRCLRPGVMQCAVDEIIERLGEFASTGGYDTSDAIFSPDGEYLVANLAPGIYLWRVLDSELLWDKIKNSMVVTFSPDGRFLAYSDLDGNKVYLASPDGAQF